MHGMRYTLNQQQRDVLTGPLSRREPRSHLDGSPSTQAYLDILDCCCRLPAHLCKSGMCCAWIDLLCLVLMLLCCMHTGPWHCCNMNDIVFEIGYDTKSRRTPSTLRSWCEPSATTGYVECTTTLST
jgi:hypothetical protein